MNTPNAEEIRTRLQQRRQHDREQMRRQEEAMDAFAVDAVRALTGGLRDDAEDGTPATQEPAVDAPAIAEEDARRAIDTRRLRPASAAPDPRPGEPALRAALRGIVADYASPLAPSDETVTALEGERGIALAEADTYGLWADLQLEAARALRAAMPEVIDVVTSRAESVIVAELVAAGGRLASEYPDAPRPTADDSADTES